MKNLTTEINNHTRVRIDSYCMSMQNTWINNLKISYDIFRNLHQELRAPLNIQLRIPIHGQIVNQSVV